MGTTSQARFMTKNIENGPFYDIIVLIADKALNNEYGSETSYVDRKMSGR